MSSINLGGGNARGVEYIGYYMQKYAHKNNGGTKKMASLDFSKYGSERDGEMHKDYAKKYAEAGTGKKTSAAIAELSNFDVDSIAYLEKYNFPSLYIFTSCNGVPRYINIFKDWAFKIITWCKLDPTPFCHNNFYPDCEYMLYFHKGTKNGRIWNNKLRPTSVYKQYYISSKQEGILDNGNERVHPTMKPLQLLSDKMQISSNKDSVVLDLFGGSGSTMVVAEQLGRECLMMEYSPKYMNVILDRMEKLGLKAEKIGHLDFADNIEKPAERERVITHSNGLDRLCKSVHK